MYSSTYIKHIQHVCQTMLSEADYAISHLALLQLQWFLFNKKFYMLWKN